MLYGDECPSERVVDPLGLVAKGSIWYLVARIDGDIRSYRVSRIREAAILDEVFARPEDFDLEQFWQSSTLRFKELLPRYPVVIRTSEPALAWLRRLIRFGGIDNVSEDGDAVRVAMHFDAEEVASAVLLGVGDQIEVIEPVALRDRMITAARAIISRGA